MAKKYRVKLNAEDRQELMALVSRGRAAAYKQTHARILLLSDENQAGGRMKDEDIARSLKAGRAIVERVRWRCVAEGLERALGAQGATEPETEAVGRSRRSPPRIQYGAGSDCPGLRRAAPSAPLRAGSRPGRLDAETVGGPFGGMGDSGEQQSRNGAADAEKTNSSPG